MGSKQQHSGVEPQASRQEAVHGGVQIFSAEQGRDAAAKALRNLGQVEAVSRGLCINSPSQDGCVGGQSNGSPATDVRGCVSDSKCICVLCLSGREGEEGQGGRQQD